MKNNTGKAVEPCEHRGDVIAIRQCQRGRFQVYACALHGECSLFHRRPETRSCAVCMARGEDAPPE